MSHARVLILDDESKLRSTLVELLEGQGYEASCAADSRSGVELATISPPDIILLDVDMPRVNGLDAIPALQLSAPNARIIIITGNASDELADAAFKRGVYDFLAKPLDYEALGRTLAAARTLSATGA
jgi:DNA-binding NtrC family response regulator